MQRTTLSITQPWSTCSGGDCMSHDKAPLAHVRPPDAVTHAPLPLRTSLVSLK